MASDAERLVDTVNSTGVCDPSCGRLAAGVPVSMTVAGVGAVPAGSQLSAVALSVTAVNPDVAGTLTVGAAGEGLPSTPSVSFSPGLSVTDRVIVPVSVDGRIVVESSAATDVWVDVVGWFVPSMVTFDYVYDGDGVRRSKSGPAGSVGFVWSRAEGLPMLLAESTAEGVRGFVYGPGGVVVAQHNPDGSVWDYHRDQLGSTVGVTDRASGAVVRVLGYGPYGAPVAVVPAVGDPPTDPDAHVPFGYAGQYTDSETGFQYLRARYYDPATGSFLTRDPIEAITRSPYAYVGGNPTNMIDPTGLWVVGVCTQAQGTFVFLSGSLTACAVYDGHSGDVLTAASGGGGFGLSGGVHVGALYSNADRIADLGGFSSCTTIALGFGPAVAFDICSNLSVDDPIVAILVLPGVGAGGSFAVSATGSAVLSDLFDDDSGSCDVPGPRRDAVPPGDAQSSVGHLGSDGTAGPGTFINPGVPG